MAVSFPFPISLIHFPVPPLCRYPRLGKVTKERVKVTSLFIIHPFPSHPLVKDGERWDGEPLLPVASYMMLTRMPMAVPVLAMEEAVQRR